MNKRTLLAFLLCGIITALYIYRMNLAQRRRQEYAARQRQSVPETPPSAPATPEIFTPSPAAAPPPAETTEPGPDVPLRDDIRIQGADLKYEATFTNRGACLSQARLTAYRQELSSEDGLLLISGLDKGSFCSLLLKDPSGRLPLDTRSYEILAEDENRIVFTSKFAGGLRVTKEFFPVPEKYEIGVRVTLKNEGPSTQTAQYRILAAARVLPEGGSRTQLEGAIGYVHESGRVRIEDRAPRKVRKAPFTLTAREEEPVVWAGSSNRYFAAVLCPVAPEGETTFQFIRSGAIEFLSGSDSIPGRTGRSKPVDNVYTSLLTHPKELSPGEEITHEYVYFLGPKKREVLEAYPNLSGLLDYGWFGAISKVLLSLLHLFYRLIPNYGIGIILLTILVKVCLHPLTRKGQVSMHKMQKLQPLIRGLQEKYKNDKQRLSREQMALFKKHGANPMSGCLPLFFQMPVFFGLFRMLQNSVDLRHEGFMLWIHDLSSPDTIGAVAGFPINILPVLMVISWLVQQSTMPKPADPQQAQTQRMMKFMPILFGFMLYSMASGLTLYWLTSTFLGIIEQKLIKLEIKKLEDQGDFPDVAAEQARAKPARGRGKRR